MKYTRSPDVLFRALDDRVVLLGTRSPDVYELNEVGAWIWNRIETAHTIEQLAPEMAAHFCIDLENARTDCSDFFKELSKLGFILTL